MLEKIKLIAKATTKSDSSRIYGNDDGTLFMSDDFVRCDGIGTPVFLYKVRIIDRREPSIGPCIYEYITPQGELKYTTTLYEIDGRFTQRYLILKTNNTEFSNDLRYSEEELEFDVDTYNLGVNRNFDENEEYDTSDFEDDDEDIEEVDMIEPTIDLYEEMCNEILFLFCEKQGYDFAEAQDMWVAGEIGTICNVGDMFVDMHDMYYDLKNDIDPEAFEQWYWNNLEMVNKISYKTFCRIHGYCEPHTEEDDDLPLLVCPKCGSDKVQTLAWVDANTLEYIDSDNIEGYCEDCEEYIDLLTEDEFEG